MTQIATVERILDAGYAEIAVPRQSACAHDCAGCAGCGVTGQVVRARARNLIGAAPGDRVVVRGGTNQILAAAALVYLGPVALFLAGYLAAAALALPVGIRYGAAAAGFLLGAVPAALYDRRIRRQGGFALRIERRF